MTSDQPSFALAHGLDIDRTLVQAMRLHEKGRLEQAEKRYTKILDADPEHSGALHLMGVLAHQAGRHSDAEALIKRSIELDPNFSDAYFNLGMVHVAMGLTDLAKDDYRRACEVNPANMSAHQNLGILHYQTERYDQALEAFDAIIALRPADALAHKNRSRALRALDRNEDSLVAIERAVELRPNDSLFQFELANALRDARKFEAAVEHYDEALRLEPDMLAALCNLGSVLKEVGRPNDALKALQRAIELDPRCAEAYVNLANLAFDRGEHQESIDLVETSLEIRPSYPEAYSALGRVLGAEAMNEDALAAFQKAIELSPKFAEAYVNLGSILQTVGEPERALHAYEIALSLKPDMDIAYWNLALALLACGRLDEGWSLFGYGFNSKQRQPYRPFPGLLWEGEDVCDKRVFVWREQGLGDDLRFSTVYHDLADKAGQLIIETDARLVPLYQRTWPKALVRAETGLSTGQDNMPVVDFDVTAPAGMAASFLRSTLSDFPADPRPLIPDPARTKQSKDWLDSLGPGPKIGFSWRSKLMTKTRALYHTKLTDWSDLLSTEGVTFVNLQYDQVDIELAELHQKFGLTIHQMPNLDLFDDLDGAAALTASLDLVISSPSSVAEMAGAVKRPTFTYAMPKHPMQLGTDHMPWFPRTRLYPVVSLQEHPELINVMTRDIRTYLASLKD